MYFRDGGALGESDGHPMVTGATVPELGRLEKRRSCMGLQDQEKGAEGGSKGVRLLKGVPVKQ